MEHSISRDMGIRTCKPHEIVLGEEKQLRRSWLADEYRVWAGCRSVSLVYRGAVLGRR